MTHERTAVVVLEIQFELPFDLDIDGWDPAMSAQDAVEKLMAHGGLDGGYDLGWIDWDDTTVDLVAEWARIPGCESTNHTRCKGELWDCPDCGRTICYQEGADDEHADVCDDCWAEKQAEVAP